jgi:hypothetical protein
MSRFFTTSAFAAMATALAACGGGGDSAPVARAVTATFSQMPDQTEANSGVRLSRGTTGDVVFTFVDGPLRDMVVVCADATGAACRVVGGPAGTMAQGALDVRMAGQHAYAATLRLSHEHNGALGSSTHHLHDMSPDAAAGTRATLPTTGIVTYTGAFIGGAGVGGQNGIAEGSVNLTVNFDSARLSGVMSGTLRGTQTTIDASFNNVTVTPGTGAFTSTADSSFMFNGALGGGTVRGGFYGPTASEAAGAFEMGSATGGGMSGVFMGCQGATASCISYAAP